MHIYTYIYIFRHQQLTCVHRHNQKQTKLTQQCMHLHAPACQPQEKNNRTNTSNKTTHPNMQIHNHLCARTRSNTKTSKTKNSISKSSNIHTHSYI
jgi:hypothetical protein